MYELMLVGTDGSPTATRAVEAAAITARAHGARLVVAHAFSPRPSAAAERHFAAAPPDERWRLSAGAAAEDVVQRAIAGARQAAGPDLKVAGRCEPGRPVAVLLGLIDELDPDAIVIGNRDMAGLRRLRSRVGPAITRRARCDVVVVDTVNRRGRGLAA